jgi:hypothetical protein
MGILVLSCCYNVEKFLPKFRKNVESLPGYSRAILFENDSTDGTLEYLETWSREDPERVSVVSQTGIFQKFPNRTVRLAYCRNQLLARAKVTPEEYLLVIDSDDVSQELDPETFATNFDIQEPWDALAVNTSYDIWALRSKECPGDCWRQVNRYSGQVGYPQAMSHYIGTHQKPVTELTPVTSAFGGAALYRGIPKSVYDGTQGCEHVPFHARANLKMFINHKWTMGRDVGREHLVPFVAGVSERDCLFVSSRGVAKRCYARNKVLRSSCPHVDEDLLDDLYDGATVYVCNTAIPNFVRNFLGRLTHRVTLYSGDSDETLSLEYPGVREILDCELITKWFPQNCVFVHPKVTHLPIGLDYHTLFENRGHFWGPQMTPVDQERQLVSLRFSFDCKTATRITGSYSNWHFHLGRGDRQEAFDQLPKDLMHYEPREVTREITHNTMLKYRFVASPYGGGPDCHRTWEALVLGCVPIFKKCGLEKGLFDGLPVILVDKWSDVTQELLESWTPPDGSGCEKLMLDFWFLRD